MSSYSAVLLSGARQLERGAENLEREARRNQAAGRPYEGMLSMAAGIREQAREMSRDSELDITISQENAGTWRNASHSTFTINSSSRGTRSGPDFFLTDNDGVPRTLRCGGSYCTDENEKMWFFNPVYEGDTLVSRREFGPDGRLLHVLMSKSELAAAASESESSQSVSGVEGDQGGVSSDGEPEHEGPGFADDAKMKEERTTAHSTDDPLHTEGDSKPEAASAQSHLSLTEKLLSKLLGRKKGPSGGSGAGSASG